MNGLFLTGASGRLGRTVQKRFKENWVIHPCSRSRGVDLRTAQPGDVFPEDVDFALNCAALSSRSSCSSDPFSAFALNALWPALLAEYCFREHRRLVHLSTDLVYSGGIPPYVEPSPAVPGSLYGWTKLLGDMAVIRRNPNALVVRTSVLVGAPGAKSHTFTEDILEGRATRFHVDCFRNHTDISLLAGYLEEVLTASASGLILAAAPWSMSRASYAYSLLKRDIELFSGPPGLPGDLTLKPSVKLRAAV